MIQYFELPLVAWPVMQGCLKLTHFHPMVPTNVDVSTTRVSIPLHILKKTTELDSFNIP